MKTILLLDDALSIRRTYSEFMQEAGFNVKAVSSTEEGLRYIVDHGTPDLIVTDLIATHADMPGISGLEFCKRVRMVSKNTPILVMSAQCSKGLVAEAKNAGVHGWMLKPVEPAYFLNKLKSLLGDPQAVSI